MAFSLSQITLQGMALALMTESVSENVVELVLKNLERQILTLRASAAERSANPRVSRKQALGADTGGEGMLAEPGTERK